MIRNEYLRFIQTLKNENVPEGVRKIANLVLDNLDDIKQLTTYQGQRVKEIVRISQEEWTALSDDLSAEVEIDDDDINEITQLTSLQVGPFRGFAKQESFDLNSPLVLIYGPNGTGKSSFCEAVEYGLLGSVVEAENKRFNPHQYLINAHSGEFSAPIIEGINKEGQVISITSNEALYRFCFVEKNRIDNFSLIAAKLPAKQTELISTLFGLDSFNSFVQNFTPHIDGSYIDVNGVKAIRLSEKYRTLENSKKVIADNATALSTLLTNEVALANQYQSEMNFAQLVSTLGNEETPGEIAALEAEIMLPVGTKTEVTLVGLNSHHQSIESLRNTLSDIEEQLLAASEGVSFKKLYEAVDALGTTNQNECPACKTPISDVATNPFILAPQELTKLSHLAQLQQEKRRIRAELLTILRIVHQNVVHATIKLGTDESPNILQRYVVDHLSDINLVWWQSLLNLEQGQDFTAWQNLQTQVQQLEQMDLQIDKAQQSLTQKQQRLTFLRELDRQITILQTQRIALEDAVESAKQNIANFNAVNQELIDEVEQEKEVVATNKEIVDSYELFVYWLREYRNSLPRQLIADLGDKVIELYNAFNRNDAEKDLLAKIKLPATQGEKIEISFRANPEQYFDALHILSEGHIRCIGLAILMAKNLNEECPLVVFDDPVNAIDDDHRESIRLTLFEDGFFDGKQIILTCHGEEFYKDIQNLLNAERAEQANKLTFLPQLDEHHINVDFNSTPRNYIIAAKNHLKALETRDALANTRRALESLTKGKVWRYVNQYGDGNLSIKMRTAKSPIELRNITEQLKSKINRGDFRHPEKDTVLNPLNTLLGLNGESREWRYLNKGTHDEENHAEFDRGTVTTMIDSLIEIDRSI